MDIEFLALVPARGGSKRLPGKNLRLLGGRPLIDWTIEAAQQSSSVDQTIVSTDCPDIAGIAEKGGAWVPYLRPASLSSDEASSIDVVIHTLDYLQGQGHQVHHVVLLQPTSPLRRSADIDQAIALYIERQADAVIAICQSEHPIEWFHPLTDDGRMAHHYQYFARQKSTRSQDLPVSYRPNGAIYIAQAKLLRQQRSFMPSTNVVGFVMPPERSIDIDTQMDFDLATFFHCRSLS